MNTLQKSSVNFVISINLTLHLSNVPTTTSNLRKVAILALLFVSKKIYTENLRFPIYFFVQKTNGRTDIVAFIKLRVHCFNLTVSFKFSNDTPELEKGSDIGPSVSIQKNIQKISGARFIFFGQKTNGRTDIVTFIKFRVCCFNLTFHLSNFPTAPLNLGKVAILALSLPSKKKKKYNLRCPIYFFGWETDRRSDIVTFIKFKEWCWHIQRVKWQVDFVICTKICD